jgi:hypothetical protein
MGSASNAWIPATKGPQSSEPSYDSRVSETEQEGSSPATVAVWKHPPSSSDAESWRNKEVRVTRFWPAVLLFFPVLAVVSVFWFVMMEAVAGATGVGLGSCGLYGSQAGEGILAVLALIGLLAILPLSVLATRWLARRWDRGTSLPRH